jgi:hypothetical protein
LNGRVSASRRATVPTYRLAVRPTPSDSGSRRDRKRSTADGVNTPDGDGVASSLAARTGSRTGADSARPRANEMP